MKVRELASSPVRDISDHVIHFTGRSGETAADLGVINDLNPEQRMMQILHERCIRPFLTFSSDVPVVCATESTGSAVRSLIACGRYASFGIGFTKQFFFDHGGGPVFYARGDEWEHVKQLAEPLRSRFVRFWPGTEPDQPGETIPLHLSNRSEWTHEREWRLGGSLNFGWGDVAFIIVPHQTWKLQVASRYQAWGDEYVHRFSSMPVVAIDALGHIHQDDVGLWG